MCLVAPPAARLAVEETVDAKQVGMREKVPDKGEHCLLLLTTEVLLTALCWQSVSQYNL